jgi:hypothetical protein
MSRQAFDYDLHIQGQENAIEREQVEAELPPIETPKDKAKAKKTGERSAARANQGDRTDLTLHLKVNLPGGYRVIPNAELEHSVKLARTRSLKAAAERRTKRRDEGGTVVHRRDKHRSGEASGPRQFTFIEDRWFNGWRPPGWFSE